MRRKYILTGRVVILLGLALVLTVGISAQTESIIHSFTNGTDGGYPDGALVSDGKGNWYGTASGGGTYFSGLVFELSPNSSGGWTEQVIYNFTGNSNPSDGARPDGPLVFDAKGNLYGVTDGGGAGAGTVFELSPNSNGTWTEKVLYSFQQGTDPLPYGGGLAFDAAGNIYGTGGFGGVYGYGGMYELIAGANGTWTEKVIYSFQGLNDGASPLGSTPLLDTAGNLYGVATGCGGHDYGVVFELTSTSGGAWTERVLYSFRGGSDGLQPNGNLLFDPSGNLFGTTISTAYKLVPGANGTWTEKTLHHFAGGTDGATALAGMVFDNAGNLYGTTQNGGAHRGAVYKLSLNSKGTWTEKILHRFAANGIDGYYPQFTSLAVDASGNVFGVTPSGGSSNAGVVYEIKP